MLSRGRSYIRIALPASGVVLCVNSFHSGREEKNDVYTSSVVVRILASAPTSYSVHQSVSQSAGGQKKKAHTTTVTGREQQHARRRQRRRLARNEETQEKNIKR